MTCEELIGFLADYVAHELEEGKTAAFERHLSKCAACVAYLETYRETILMSRAAAAAELVEELPPELVEAIRAAVA